MAPPRPGLGYHEWLTAGGNAKNLCEASTKFPCWTKVKPIAGARFEASINTDYADAHRSAIGRAVPCAIAHRACAIASECAREASMRGARRTP